MTPQYANIAGEVVAGVIEGLGKTAVAAVDSTQRRKFEQAVAVMNAGEQRELNRRLLTAQTQAAKVQVVLDTIAKRETEQQRQQAMTRNIVLIGGILIVIVGIVAITLKRK